MVRSTRISSNIFPFFIFHRILKRKCTAALKPFLLTWNGSCTTASSTTEVKLFNVPLAASLQASSQSAVDLPTLFQVTTNWPQPQRSSSRFASTRYSAGKRWLCGCVLCNFFPYLTLWLNMHFADEWDWGVPRVLLVCVSKKRQLVLWALRKSSHHVENDLYVTHLAYSKASKLFLPCPW